ncbi:MAG: extracellular solute-binding protein [Ignisphaera sp.]
MKKETVIAIAIIVALVSSLLYILFTIQTPVTLPSVKPKGNFTLMIVTTWSQWHIDDFKQWMFYVSGQGLGGVLVKAPAAQELGIKVLEFVRENDLTKWVELARSGNISGFTALPMARYNATWLCDQGVFKPIEDPALLDLAKKLPEAFKGYTSDGKLCWIATDFVTVNNWFINTKATEELGVQVPSSWEELLDPKYASVLLNNGYVAVIGGVDRDPVRVAFHVLLQKYGWDKGWVYITYLAGTSYLARSLPEARDDVIYQYEKVILTILDLERALLGLPYSKDLKLVFPKEATAVRVSPIGVAKAANEDATEGMYRLIRYLLTEGQNEIYMKRWQSVFPVLPTNHTSIYIVYQESATKNIYLEFNEKIMVDLQEATDVYTEVLFKDGEVHKLLRNIIKSLAEKYQKGEIDLNEYYEFLNRVGEPVEFVNPLTNTKTRFSMDVASQLAEALKTGSLQKQTLYDAIKEALLSRLQQMVLELGIQ